MAGTMRRRYVAEVTEEALARINEIAAALTRQGPGKYGQKEAISYLVQRHDLNMAALDRAFTRTEEET